MSKCNLRQAALDALAANLKSARGAVIAFLQWTGRAADAQLPIEVLYREAKARLDALASAWTEAKTREVTKLTIERDLREAADERDAALAALAGSSRGVACGDERDRSWRGCDAGAGGSRAVGVAVGRRAENQS